MDASTLALLIPVVAIVGGITAAVVRTISRARVRELEIRERIAMIERGLVPAPEKDPHGFERAMNRYQSGDWNARSPRRYRSMGITLMGVGFGLMVLIGIAGHSPASGLGVGGFLVILGLAFFVIAVLETRQPGGASQSGMLPSPKADSDSDSATLPPR